MLNFEEEIKKFHPSLEVEDAEEAINKLFETNGSISLCPYYDIKTEYRSFYLDGKVLLIYGKTKPFVIGDGNSTLRELIEKLKYL